MNKHWLISLAAAAVLSACGAPQSAVTSSVVPRGAAVPRPLSRGHSWMLKEASTEDLVYVSENGEYNNPGVYVYSYPEGNQVGFLQEFSGGPYQGLCSGTNGTIWALAWDTNGQAFYIEYAHGGTQPLQDIISVGEPAGCSVDPKTGDLAIANYQDFNIGRRGDVEIFPPGSNKGTAYYDDSIKYYYWCAYDNDGNLYADGNTRYLNVLYKGSGTLRHVYFKKAMVPGSLQWDSSGSLALTEVGGAKNPVRIDRVTIEGSGAQITGRTKLETKPGWGNYLNVQTWIQGDIVASAGPGDGGPVRALYFWKYPKGGKPIKKIAAPASANFFGVAISPGP